MMWRLLAVLLTTLTQDVSITLTPHVLQAGSDAWITCRVTPDARNRYLYFGITSYTHSIRELEGSDAPITWGPTLIKHIPCDVGPAYCMVVRRDGTSQKAESNLEITGCDDQ